MMEALSGIIRTWLSAFYIWHIKIPLSGMMSFDRVHRPGKRCFCYYLVVIALPRLKFARELIGGIDPDRLFRQGIKEGMPVIFCQDAIVQDNDAASVCVGSDQSSAALTETQDSLWQAVGSESVLTL